METAAYSDEVSVSITNSYVSAGTALTVQTEGYSEGSSLQYKWTVDGVDTGSSGDSYTPSADDAEKWIQVTVSCAGYEDQTAEIYFSELPVMYLDFDLDAVIADKTTYVDGTMNLQGNGTYTSSSQLYSGALEVKGRGNTSWNADKKPFKLKLDAKTNLLGMGKNKHWVLLANATEGSMMRNDLAYKLSGLWGLTYQDGTWVEVVINGEYYGTYYLCEHVRVGSTRVDIEDLADAAADAADAVVEAGLLSDADGLADAMEEDLSWISSDSFTYGGVTFKVSDYYAFDKNQLTSGGFLFELDAYYDEVSKFRSSLNQPIMFNTPEYANTNQDMMDYAKEFINAFEASIQSADFQASYNGETVSAYDLFDFDSLVSYWMIQELFMNEDGMKKSTYFYKDQDTADEISKMFMGPVWDMDWSSDGEGGGDYTAWQTVYYNDGAQANQWYKYLCQDPYFLTEARAFYWEHRSEILDMVASIYGEADNDIFTDNAYSYLYDAAVANETLWGKYKLGYDGEVAKLYTWLNNRISWLDENMASIDTMIDSMGLYDPDESIGLAVTDGVLNITASSRAAKAEVRINGTVVSTVTLTNGAGSFDASTMLTGGQDVIHVIIYDSRGNSLGSNFIYDQEEDEQACTHDETYLSGATEATCTEDGYTGDLYCAVCDELLEEGSVIPATGHTVEIQNAVAATCTTEGYTGDEVCTVCGETVSTGSVIAATGHSWDSGVVTKEATEDEEGEMTYTCTVCGETKTETIAFQKELSVPSVTLSVDQGTSGKIRLTATVTGADSDDYYEVTGHGFVYITKAKLGAKALTVNTSSRTKVSVSGFSSDSTYIYSMTPKTTDTVYVVRAYVTYKNASGKTVYVYSDQVVASYNSLTV
ncbi:MAG: CotH kinase family protein [Clostridiales bacterium]|nr:CotH kinase family protein [Clostridiales bacterium]